MFNRFLLAAVLVAASVPDLEAKNKDLIGHWEKDGESYAELKADGSGSVGGEPVTWNNLGRMLFISHPGGETETMAFTLKGDHLQLDAGAELLNLYRGKGGAKKPAAKPAKEKEKAQAGGGDLQALMVSSPWCSFTYNKISGASHQERIVFRANGSWSSGARGETYSSGPNGSVAGQSDSSGAGRWQAKGGKLFMAEGYGALEDTGLSVSRNSNGYPILKSGKKEYSQCD